MNPWVIDQEIAGNNERIRRLERIIKTLDEILLEEFGVRCYERFFSKPDLEVLDSVIGFNADE